MAEEINIWDLDTVIGNTHESVTRSYHILECLKSGLKSGTPPHALLDWLEWQAKACRAVDEARAQVKALEEERDRLQARVEGLNAELNGLRMDDATATAIVQLLRGAVTSYGLITMDVTGAWVLTPEAEKALKACDLYRAVQPNRGTPDG